MFPKASIEYLCSIEKIIDTPGSLLQNCCDYFYVGKIEIARYVIHSITNIEYLRSRDQSAWRIKRSINIMHPLFQPLFIRILRFQREAENTCVGERKLLIPLVHCCLTFVLPFVLETWKYKVHITQHYRHKILMYNIVM